MRLRLTERRKVFVTSEYVHVFTLQSKYVVRKHRYENDWITKHTANRTSVILGCWDNGEEVRLRESLPWLENRAESRLRLSGKFCTRERIVR